MNPMPKFTVRIGNIATQANSDAIINSTKAKLRAGSGVCGAICTAA